ncbi:MAG: hypothetical protein HQL63_14360 [Magnetococcales bacterium]|nr:hypothetical protein [Magnetococcales bacterium]
MLRLWRIAKIVVLGVVVALLLGLLTRYVLGHFLAMTRIRHEGSLRQVVPLGARPWVVVRDGGLMYHDRQLFSTLLRKALI